MGMGTRMRSQRQERLWISHNELAKGPGHPSAGIHAIVSKGDGPNMILVHARNLLAVPA